MSDYPQQYISQVEAAIDIRRLFEVIGFHSSKLQETDEEFRAFCPIHQDVVFRTMIVSKKTRSFRCTYARCDGQKGGGLIQLYAVSRKAPFDSALQMLLNELGIKIRPPADPEHIRKNLEFAENYLMLEYFEEAGKLFADLLESQPDLTRALEGLLLVYVKTGNRQGELEVREKLGQLLLKQGQNTEALEHGRQVAEEQPDSIEAHQLLAECLAASADNEAAM